MRRGRIANICDRKFSARRRRHTQRIIVEQIVAHQERFAR
jgi:hypothetical protein